MKKSTLQNKPAGSTPKSFRDRVCSSPKSFRLMHLVHRSVFHVLSFSQENISKKSDGMSLGRRNIMTRRKRM